LENVLLINQQICWKCFRSWFSVHLKFGKDSSKVDDFSCSLFYLTTRILVFRDFVLMTVNLEVDSQSQNTSQKNFVDIESSVTIFFFDHDVWPSGHAVDNNPPQVNIPLR
jgi:hypothetical protein